MWLGHHFLGQKVKDQLVADVLNSQHPETAQPPGEQAVWEDATLCPRRPALCDLDLWAFDLESGVWVTCDVCYLCANFSLPKPLCSRIRPDVRDRRQTDVSIIA